MSDEARFEQFFKFLRKRRVVLIYFILIFLILALGFSFLRPQEYSSKVSVLIIQKINPNLDAYTAARSAEKLGKNLASVIFTTSFFEKVRHSNFDLNLNLPENERAKRQAWQNKIEAKVSGEGSMLEITAYDQERAEAEKLAQVISYILATEGKEYHGGGDDIVIKPVNTALTSNRPARPNIVLNLLAGLIAGVIFGLLVIFWQFNRRLSS